MILNAIDVLKKAITILEQRSEERDCAQERSMAATINAFNALSNGAKLNEDEGWLFMVCLKLARAKSGRNSDDYLDAAAYLALLEEYLSEQKKTEPMNTKPPQDDIWESHIDYPAPEARWDEPSWAAALIKDMNSDDNR